MWKSYWRLERERFAQGASPYVALPSHDEAVARLVWAIESGERRALLTAAAGMGKTEILRRAFELARQPGRQFARLSCPREGTLLVATLAEKLGERVAREPSRLGAWRALERAIRVALIQCMHVVIGIENCEVANAGVLRDIGAISNLAVGAGASITVIRSGQPRPSGRIPHNGTLTPSIRLNSLTRSEAETLLTTKLRSASRDESIFSARAVTRLHCLSGGVPRQLEQLATLCLIEAAGRGLERISPELVDEVEESQNDTSGLFGRENGTGTMRTRAG